MGGRYHYHMLCCVSRCSASPVLGAALGVALPATAGWGRLPGLQPAASCGASPAAADELALTAGSAATHVRALGSAAWSATSGAGDGGSWDDPCDINALRTTWSSYSTERCNELATVRALELFDALHLILRPASCYTAEIFDISRVLFPCTACM